LEDVVKIGRQRAMLWLLALTIVALTGCAQQVGDIDRTQPNKVEKKIFDDGSEWYMRATVVDTSGYSSASFVGLQGQMFRVRWEIEEGYLMAYKTHEDYIGVDTNDYDPERDGPFNGTPKAAFPIRQHFDVQRSYSSSTGEQSNVIVENGSDRPWYERDFMRVDWSRNVAPALDWWDPALEMQKISGLTIPAQNEGVEESDVTWHFEYDENGEANYLDVVNTYIIQPNINRCLLTFGFTYNAYCGPQTVKVRMSFVKITDEVEADHIAVEYDDLKMEEFGYFRTERCYYDRHYGCRESTTRTLANVWPIWSDNYDENGEERPKSERSVKPIVYYLSADFPEDLKPESYELMDDWNGVFVNAVKVHQPDYAGRVIYLCENPGAPDEPGYADGVCKNPGVEKQIGDLRYSQLVWVDHVDPASPLGYGPSEADPLTGALINANANIYGSAVDTYSQYVIDIVLLLNGDIDPEAFGLGDYYKQELAGYDYFAKNGLFMSNERMNAMREESMANVKGRIEDRDGRIFDLVDMMKDLTVEQKMDMLRPEHHQGQARWNSLKGSPVEALMLNEEISAAIAPDLMEEAQGADEEGLDEGDLLSRKSPIDMGSYKGLMQNHDQMQTRFMTRNMMMMDFVDNSYLGIAKELKTLWDGDWAEMSDDEKMDASREWVRGRVYKGVMEHEVGHTLGLRHNFAGSFDAVNFPKEYWDRRFRDYDGDGTVDALDPRQPMTTEQYESGIRHYQLSSTMDYGAKAVSDFGGIGLYDHAAIAYAYADAVFVFDNAPNKVRVDYGSEAWEAVTRSEEAITDFEDVDVVVNGSQADLPGYEDDGVYDNDLDFYHYAVLPTIFDTNNDRDMSELYERTLVKIGEEGDKVRVPFRFCSDDYRGGRPSCQVWDEGASFEEIMDNYIQAYHNYYFHNAFKRDRKLFGRYQNLTGYFNRILGRYFYPISGVYAHWVLRLFRFDNEWYQSEWGGQLGWASIERGISNMMNTLVSVHPGTYSFDSETQEWINLSSNTGYRPGGDSRFSEFMDVPVGVGKYAFTKYDGDAGYYYFRKPVVISQFWDRWAAFIALTNPVRNFIGVDSSSDIQSYSLPITLLYDDELYRWFGAIMNDDLTEIGPIIVEDEQGNRGFEFQNPTARSLQRASYRNKDKVNPYPAAYGNSSLNNELWAMVTGLAWFQDRFDTSFNALALVMVKGRGESIELAPGWESIEWTDPVTAKTYVAFKGDFQQARGLYPIGWNMVKQAVDYEDLWRTRNCPDGYQDLSECDLFNSEYYDMSNHRETLDLLVLSHRSLEQWNDYSWVATW
jgi:hypothetical protein